MDTFERSDETVELNDEILDLLAMMPERARADFLAALEQPLDEQLG